MFSQGRMSRIQFTSVERASPSNMLIVLPLYSMDCSLPGSSVHGIFQARLLEWGAIAFSLKHMGKAD